MSSDKVDKSLDLRKLVQIDRTLKTLLQFMLPREATKLVKMQRKARVIELSATKVDESTSSERGPAVTAKEVELIK